ncbi:ARM repeat-containing protein [Fomitopsis serialis]|uniref:ARM repeat-containing protein n=1 Tax=Fomitopsis serialis TaxID=139415 RepID=UPI0020077340|nr:ARM repeat-containing protein [Neoantrodia serialis]KAH9938596.1 ARM repeat-containing protein [Neoantrodia serialis]
MPPPTASTETFSPEELYNVVCSAASQDPAQLQASATRLKEILQLFGAYDTLYEIASQRTVPLPVRQQSIIQFKNSAISHWRSRKLFSDQHRERVRVRCLSLLDETDDVIAECNEVIIAKIARYDLPQNWPALIPHLLGTIGTNVDARYGGGQGGSAIHLRRSLEVLNAILKEFMSVKLPSGLKVMGALVQELHQPLQGHYSRVASSFPTTTTPASISQSRHAEDLLFAHLIFKCVVKSAEWTWNRIVHNSYEHLEPWIQQLFQASAMQLQSLSELRINLMLALQTTQTDEIGTRSVDILTRHVRLFGKLFRRMQQLASSRFIALPLCSDLVMYYWSKVVQASNAPAEAISDTWSAVFPVRFLVQAMVLFKDSLAQWAPVRKDGSQNANALSKEFVENAVQLLVTRFIPLNPSDLEEWVSDPEGWVNLEEQDNEQWVFEIRPCAERVLMTLANNYQQYVTPLLDTTFKQAVGQRPVDLPGVVQKEALYCAVGRCATRLKESIPFGQWLEHTLIAEAQDSNASYPILKRRIAWLVGKWISDDCYPANDPKIWQVLLYLLQDRGQGSDEVVRLTAAMALRECVDTLSFDVDVFTPFLSTSVNELVRLMAESETLEAKRRIANSLNTVIERAGTRIVPLIGNIAQPLPQLWNTAGEDWLFKVSLLGTLTNLVQSSMEHSVTLTSLVVHLIQQSFTPGAQLHLDQDALALWLIAIRNSTTLEGVDGGPGYISLFPLVISLLSENLDLLGSISEIVESYLLVDATRILQLYAVELFQAFAKAMTQAVETNVGDMARILTTLFQIGPPQLWGEPLHRSGLFALVVKTLTDDKAKTSILTEEIYVLARVAVANKQLFLQLMQATAQAHNVSEAHIWEGVLDQWWTRFDNMSEPRHRKLTAMGIASLISTGRQEVLGRLSSEVCNLWLDVFGEIKETESQAAEPDPTLTRYWDRPTDQFFQGSEDTLEYERRKALYENDPVRTTKLTTYIATCLAEAEMACGGPANLQAMYLAKADPTVLGQLQAELARP